MEESKPRVSIVVFADDECTARFRVVHDMLWSLVDTCSTSRYMMSQRDSAHMIFFRREQCACTCRVWGCKLLSMALLSLKRTFKGNVLPKHISQQFKTTHWQLASCSQCSVGGSEDTKSADLSCGSGA